MTLQSSASGADPLTFSEIRTEFSYQGTSTSFRAYLKNAGIVDSDDDAPSVPTSGTMNMLNFLGAGMRLGMISNQSALNYSLNGIGGTATATYRLGNNGVARRTNVNGVLTDISGEWLVGAGPTSDFEVYVSWSAQGGGDGYDGGGSVGGGTPLTWLNLGTTRDFTLSATNNYVQRGLTVQIRYIPTSTIVDTATILFEVDSAP